MNLSINFQDLAILNQKINNKNYQTGSNLSSYKQLSIANLEPLDEYPQNEHITQIQTDRSNK